MQEADRLKGGQRNKECPVCMSWFEFLFSQREEIIHHDTKETQMHSFIFIRGPAHTLCTAIMKGVVPFYTCVLLFVDMY